MIRLLSLLMATELLLPYAQAPKPKASSFESHVQCYEQQQKFDSSIEQKISTIISSSLEQPFTVNVRDNNITIKITDTDYTSPTKKEIAELTTCLKDEYTSLCGLIGNYLESQDVESPRVQLTYLSNDGVKLFQTTN